jgi:D-alanyl-D-alanine dipeptidase
MLGWAQSLLPRGYRLLIIEGYRPPILQRRLFQALFLYLHCLYPEWEPEQLREATNVLIADPDIGAPPPHATGGAVDLTMVHAGGCPVDMTSPLGWTEASAPTDCDQINREARGNRLMLVEALSIAGLTNYPGEWWHWSYGEPGWAVRSRRAAAIYGPVTSPYAHPAPASGRATPPASGE